jgi:integrase
MLQMGRPRTKHKHMPPGMRLVDGRWYWRATDEASRLALQRLAPGRRGIPAGKDNADTEAVRKWWAAQILPALAAAVPSELAKPGTVAEILDRADREIKPTYDPKTQDEWTRYIRNLCAEFGAMRYAKSEAQAATGEFLRAMNLTQYLDRQARAGRPVAANKEVQALSRMFHVAKARWGYTEYNPCLQVEFNSEAPRLVYQDDASFMKVYEKAPPLLQVMMDLAQIAGPRRGMLLKLNLADIASDGLWFTRNKKKRNAPVQRQLVRFVDDRGEDTGLREVVDRARELRAKVRGGQKVVADLATAPLFLNRRGKRVSETGFNSMWQRAARAAGFGAHEYHFHDNRRKSASDAPTEQHAQDLLLHNDPRTTRTVYRAKPIEVLPLKRVSKKA